MSAHARRIRQALIARARRLSPSLTSERGSVLVITIFALTALIGMTSLTVDSGRYFVERRQLQNAADAAALAAARYLPANDAALQAAAENDASAVATANGLDAGDVQVTFLTTAVADDTVAVSTTRTVAFAFACSGSTAARCTPRRPCSSAASRASAACCRSASPRPRAGSRSARRTV